MGKEAVVGMEGQGSQKEQPRTTSSAVQRDAGAGQGEDECVSACSKDSPGPAVADNEGAASVGGKRMLGDGAGNVRVPAGGEVLIASAQQRKKHHHHLHPHDQHKQPLHRDHHHGTDRQAADVHQSQTKDAVAMRAEQTTEGAEKPPALGRSICETSRAGNTDRVVNGGVDVGDHSESQDDSLLGKSVPLLAPCDSAKCDSTGSSSKTVEDVGTVAATATETTQGETEGFKKLPELVHGEECETEQQLCNDDVADFEEMLANELTPGLEDKIADVISDSVAEAVDTAVGGSMAGVNDGDLLANVDADDGCFLPDLTPPDMDPADPSLFPIEIEASNELECEEEREILQGQEEGEGGVEEEGEEEEEDEGEGDGVDDELEALYFIKRLPDVSRYRPHMCRPLLPPKKAGAPPVTLVLDLDGE